MIEFIVPVVIIVLALIGIQRRNNLDDFLSLKQGTCLKGLAALLLVVVHITERLPYRPIAYSALAEGVFVSICFLFLLGIRNNKKEYCEYRICK